jgi:putative aldouronate transport system permease protein
VSSIFAVIIYGRGSYKMTTTTVKIRKKDGVFSELKRNIVLYLLVLPAAAYTFIYGYVTLPFMIIAFQKYSFRKGLGSPFVGLKNFTYFFNSSWAWIVTRNTILLNLLFIISGTLCAVGLALLLNEVRKKTYLKVSQTFMLLPFFLSWVIVSYILEALLSTDAGFFNKLLGNMGIAPVSFYSEPRYWYYILVLLRVWKVVGYTSIIYLAVITGIDEGLYEAAYIDGASRLKRVWYITLPLLFPTVSVLTLMDIGRIFYGDFGMFYAIIRDNGSLMPMAEVIDTYVFRIFKYTGDPSIAMAVGMYQSIIGFILVFGSNALIRKFYPDGSLF